VRNDVLVYTSEPLESPVEVTGKIGATIYASSTAPDTDFTVKLVDVHPCGRAIYLTDGILRARFRDGAGAAPDLVPGEVYEFSVDVGVTSNVFLAGHRIQVAVSSSNFPMYDRNPNSGNVHGSDRIEDVRPATQIIWHSEEYPSHVALPIVPAR
jgi:putative CocE/NonD family hydrolase